MPEQIDAERVLGRCLVFRAADEAGRRLLASRSHRKSFQTGQWICHYGDDGTSLMAIAHGAVRILLPNSAGREMVLGDIGAGEVLGEIALLDGKSRSASAKALTNCELIVLERSAVVAFLEANPRVCLRLLELLCERVRKSDERTIDIAFSELPVRLAKALLARRGEGQQKKIALSQAELASMIGGTRENVNRHLRDWQRRGILDRKDGWIVIMDEDALTEIAAGP